MSWGWGFSISIESRCKWSTGSDPNVAPPFVDPREVLEGEPQVEEGVLDDIPAVPAPSRRESVPAEAEEVPAAGNLEEDETMDVDLRGDEDDDEMDLGMIERLDHCIHWYHQDVWNEFASQESCMEVGSKGTVFFRNVWWNQD